MKVRMKSLSRQLSRRSSRTGAHCIWIESRDIYDGAPAAHLLPVNLLFVLEVLWTLQTGGCTFYVLSFKQLHFNVEDGRHSESERGARHQVRDDAFVGLAFVYLAELFFVINFDTDAIL